MTIESFDIEDIESVDDIDDIDPTNKANGRVLVYRSASGNLEYELPSGGGGANVKSGLESAITEGTTRAVTFVTAFSSTPNVVVSFSDNSSEQSTCMAHSVSTTGFTIGVEKIGGGQNRDRTVAWIATDAGNS